MGASKPKDPNEGSRARQIGGRQAVKVNKSPLPVKKAAGARRRTPKIVKSVSMTNVSFTKNAQKTKKNVTVKPPQETQDENDDDDNETEEQTDTPMLEAGAAIQDEKSKTQTNKDKHQSPYKLRARSPGKNISMQELDSDMEEDSVEGAETEDEMETEKILGKSKGANTQTANQNIEKQGGRGNGKDYWTTENLANTKANLVRLREHMSCPNIKCTAVGSLVNNGSGGSGPMAKCGACAAKITGFELKTLLESTARRIEI